MTGETDQQLTVSTITRYINKMIAYLTLSISVVHHCVFAPLSNVRGVQTQCSPTVGVKRSGTAPKRDPCRLSTREGVAA